MRTLKLRTELTEEEIHERSLQMAQLVNESARLADEKREKAKSYKKQFDDKKKLIEELSEEVTTRHEMREVEVQEMREDKHMVTYRCDTGGTVSRRKLTQSELEGKEDIGDDADDMGARAAEGSRIPHETPAAGRTAIKKPDAWKATAEAAKRETAADK